MEVLAAIRDVAVIILALLNIVLIGVMVVIAFQVLKLINLISREFPSLVETAKRSATSIQGTADFVGSAVAQPAINAISLFVAARRFLRALALGRATRREARERPERPAREEARS